MPCLKWLRKDDDDDINDVWLDVVRILKLPPGLTSSKLTFGHLLRSRAEIINQVEALKEISVRAQSERVIRQGLRDLETWSAGTLFVLTDFQDSKATKVAVIKEWKEVFTKVGECLALLSNLKESNNKNYEDKIAMWEKKFGTLDECLHDLNQVQRKWVYLEPIFGRGALPKEQSRFKGVDRDLRDIMQDVVKDTRVVSLVQNKDVGAKLKNMVDQLQRCQKALNEFLEVSKYYDFPILHQIKFNKIFFLRKRDRSFHASISSATMIYLKYSVKQQMTKLFKPI